MAFSSYVGDLFLVFLGEEEREGGGSNFINTIICFFSPFFHAIKITHTHKGTKMAWEVTMPFPHNQCFGLFPFIHAKISIYMYKFFSTSFEGCFIRIKTI